MLDGHSPQRRAEHKPEIIDEEPEQESESSAEEAKDSSESEDELDEDEIERRRQVLRAKLAAREAEKEILGQDEPEEMLDGPRVKPVFVRASDRMTVAERERKVKQQKKEEVDARKEKEDRRREALKLGEHKEGNINDVCTDDENDELERKGGLSCASIPNSSPTSPLKENTRATLDDHFDKTVLPKDTTEFDSAWSSEGGASRLPSRGGLRQVFEKPSAKRKHKA
ncbi:Microfibrillar-associated protein, partial [Operophtera brumata]